MSGKSETSSNRGGCREGAGRPPATLKGLLRTLPPANAGKLRRDIRRSALRMLISWARAELREVE
jgi:hypothetical protein